MILPDRNICVNTTYSVSAAQLAEDLGLQTKGIPVLSIFVSIIGGVMLAVVFYREIDRREGPAIIIEDAVMDATIVVAVDGAVASPGLVALPQGSRWGDAIQAAGGMTAAADVSRVNAAARLADGERLDIPALAPVQGNSRLTGPADRVATPMQTSVEPEDPGLVNINRGSAAELDALPGIGPVLAQRIVDRRQAVGHFSTVDDLAEVAGISPRMVDELRALVTV